jgi:hypothetical protein
MPQARRHPYTITRESGSLWEVPPATVRVCGVNLPVAGGGYFRLLPFWWTCWGLHRINRREGESAVVYIHPWEIDPDQPRFATDSMTRVRHYGNLRKTEDRIRRLLARFHFIPMGEALSGGLRPEADVAHAVAERVAV